MDFPSRQLGLFFCVVLSFSVPVAVATDISGNFEVLDTSESWRFVESQNFDDPGNPPLDGYQSVTPRPQVFAEFGKAYWFHTTLSNNAAVMKDVVLVVSNPFIRRATLQLYDQNGLVRTYSDGVADGNLATKPIPVSSPIFRINLPPGANYQLYLHVASLDAMRWHAQVWSPEHYAGQLANRKLLMGLLLGGIFSLAIYSFVVAGVSRQKSYLYLGLCLGSLVLLQIAIQNLGAIYLWPEYASLNRYILVPTLVLFASSWLIFGHEFLQLGHNRTEPSLLSRVVKGWIWLAIPVTTLLTVFAPVRASLLFAITAMIPLTMLMAYAVMGAWRGLPAPRLYLLACAPLFVGMFVLGLNRVFAWGWPMEMAQMIMLSASAVLSLAMAGALAMHIRQLTREAQESKNAVLLAKLQTREAEQASASALQESAAKTAFLATMSHEIRTPMNGILGMAQLLSESELDKHQQTYIHTLRQSGESLMAILNDILDYSKFENGNFELEMVETDVEEFFDGLTLLFRDPIRKKGLGFYLDIEPQTPASLVFDSTRVRQVTANLLNNAVKFTTSGEVVLRVGFNDGQLILKVIDQGIGIDPEHQVTLFDRFKQADSSISRRFGGTGLGLAICKQICDRMQGKIEVHSEPGSGSEFCVTLPVEIGQARLHAVDPAGSLTYSGIDPQQQRCLKSFARRYGMKVAFVFSRDGEAIVDESTGRSAALGQELTLPLVYGELKQWLHPQEASVSESGGERILQGQVVLVAEDNATNRMVAGKLLERWGASVLFAQDGQEAIEVFESHARDIDVVLMDCEMPRMDGYAATRVIRSLGGEGGAVPIIALTAHALPEYREQAMDAGMTDYVTKPLEKAKLLSALETAFAHTSIASGGHQ